MMKKFNYAVIAAAVLGLAGFSGTTLSADDAAKKPEAAAGEPKQAEQGKPDDKIQAKPGDTAQDKKAEAGAVKLQDYSKVGAYSGGKPVGGSTGQVAGDKPAGDKGAAGPAAPAGDASKEQKPEAEKKQ